MLASLNLDVTSFLEGWTTETMSVDAIAYDTTITARIFSLVAMVVHDMCSLVATSNRVQSTTNMRIENAFRTTPSRKRESLIRSPCRALLDVLSYTFGIFSELGFDAK